ncbi:TORTIFOLIA1-like protein 1 isoform X2 [Lotus japonicus]|uniref:TORTIFOLIA1-like protein 1 isoform X2 n=1 Tax=Lotus japonicus TaxID=34305 RepID=UPI002585CD70|nr:TORTIFOLIA1-like protein 1 isoform X2 [Lotus japonicus]
MIEALQLWKKIAGKGDGSPNDGGNPESAVSSETSDLKKENFEERKSDPQVKEPSTSSSNTDLTTKAKPAGISEKAVVILEKEAPVLSDKELNPEFFQKHEKRGSDDLPVEVVVPRRCLNSSSSNNEEESEASAKDSKEGRTSIGNIPNDDSRQILMQVERLHVDMMNRLQTFMDQSRDSMVSLENSVWGLERTVEAKYNGFKDYSNAKYGRDGDVVEDNIERWP